MYHNICNKISCMSLSSGKLKFNPEPKSRFLELDSDAEIHCNAEAETNPKVHWIKGTGNWENGRNLDFNSHIIDADGTLYFRGVQRNDAGPYTCVAYVSKGSFQELINKTIYIYVVGMYKPVQEITSIVFRDHIVSVDHLCFMK